MSSSSINSSTSCYCGKETPIRISTTDGNPGRKFLGCYRFPAKTCDYFRWVDPPTTPSSIQKKLDYMINRNDELDSKNSALEKKCRGIEKELEKKKLECECLIQKLEKLEKKLESATKLRKMMNWFFIGLCVLMFMFK
ncbi:hypothetical protein FRX31_012887 [Thalictrum thalictroides]|uniref:GRF-type domain-containing protein n=1 Tax=Thalictrum thalictroides TaxID=46969 RepID=A0A7J6WJH6_THATH|nr:hypothetical protein FRX31_012887 [Thalictrum thalictroides]